MLQAARREAIFTADFTKVCLTNLYVFLGFYILMPTLPKYVESLIGPGRDTLVGLVMGAFTFSGTLSRPFIGRTLDQKDRKPVILAGLATFVVIAASYNLATSLAVIFLLRLVHGLGWAGSTTGAVTLVADLAPARQRGEAAGYFGMFSNLAMSIGPALGYAMLVKSYSLAFGTSAALALLALAVAATIREPLREKAPSAGPLLNKDSFFPALVMFFVTLTYGSVTFVIFWGEEIGVGNPGIYFTVFALFLVVTRVLAGTVSDRYGRPAVLVPALILTALAYTILSVARGTPLYALSAALNGMGFGSAHPALMAMAIDSAGPGHRGTAMATFALSFDLGIGIGNVLFGALAESAGYSMMYLSSAVVAALGLAFYASTLRRRT